MAETHLSPGVGSPGHYASPAPEAHNLVASGKGAVAAVYAENKSGAKLYLYVFDGVDATGSLIAGPYPVDSHGFVAFDNAYGIEFKIGLFVALSTSDAAYAADAGADGWFNVDWRGL